MMPRRRIYLASSWRNQQQPEVLKALREIGHEVYDFRHPVEGNDGFGWRQIQTNWQDWSPQIYLECLKHPLAQTGFALDRAALEWGDTCVLLLPSGRSAHIEAGYMAGQRKDLFILLSDDGFEPELMYLLGREIFTSLAQLTFRLA